MAFDVIATNSSSHTCHARLPHLPRTSTRICLHNCERKHPHQRSWFGYTWTFLRFTTGATNDSPRWRLMCLRRKAAPTLATHLCHIFPEQSKAVYGCTPQPTYFVFKHVHPYHKLANNHIYGCTQPIYGCTPQRTYLIRVNLYMNDNCYGYTHDSCVNICS